MEYPPKILSRSRRVAAATASGLPIAVAAGAIVTVTIAFSGATTDLNRQSHTRIRISVLGSAGLASDSAANITIQTANIQTASGNISQPLNTGSSLGSFDSSVLSGYMEYDTDDLPAITATQPTGFSIIIVVKNSDASGHNVTAATCYALIEATQYADAYLDTV